MRTAVTGSFVYLLVSSIGLLQAAEYEQSRFRFPASTEKIVVADLNGDQREDLIAVVDDGLRLFLQQDEGFDFEQGYLDIDFQASSVGWDLHTAFSENGAVSIVSLLDGNRIAVWSVQGNSVQEPEILLSSLPGFLPRGTNRLHFLRDINNDGAIDFIVPGAGQLHLMINTGDNEFQAPLAIASPTRLRTALNNNRFNRSAGQAIVIPQLELRDVNNDQYDDLIARTPERLDVFIANKGSSSYFSPTPSYSLDIAAIEEELGEFDIDNLDFSNLTGVLALTHEEILEDVTGDSIVDLVLREGGKVSLFSGTATGMNFEQPNQVLRSGGNVLSTFLYDENEDGQKDLWLWRVEPISVGDVFVWLALSGSIAIEAFVYPNEGERFARRPARRITVNLRFPSVMRLANAFQELDRAAESLSAEQINPNRAAALGGTATQQDLLVLIDNRVDVFLDSIEPAEDEDFLGALGYSRDRDDYEIDIRRIIENVDINQSRQLTQLAGETASFSLQLPAGDQYADILAANLNNDGIDDLFIFQRFDGSHIEGLLLLSKEFSQ